MYFQHLTAFSSKLYHCGIKHAVLIACTSFLLSCISGCGDKKVSLYNEAYSLLETYRFNEALSLYDSLIVLDSNNVNIYVERAYIKGKLYDYFSSLEDYKISLKLVSKYTGNLKEFDKEVLIPKDEGDIQCIRRGYVDELIRRAYGDYKYKLSDYINRLNQMLDRDSLTAEALHCIGNAHYYLKEYESAKAAYSKVIRLDPNAWDAFYARGNVSGVLGLKDDSIADYYSAEIILATEVE